MWTRQNFVTVITFFLPKHLKTCHWEEDVVLCPSFRDFLERPQLDSELLSSRDLTQSRFANTLIAGNSYRNLVTRHFQIYPVLYIDLKVNRIVTQPVCLTIPGCYGGNI